MASGFSSKYLGKEIDNEISYVREELRDIIKRHENNIDDISKELNDVSSKIPTKVSELENDKGYMLSTDLVGQTTVEEKINTEIADRENGDKELESLINSLITTEATERKENDDSKANMTDVLTKDNTTAYSPTSNYHPATKKYVDDIAINSGAGDMLRSVYDMNGNGIVDNAEKLGGVEAEKYALQTYVQEKTDKIMSDLTGPSYNVNVKIGESIPTNATKLVGVTSSTEISWYGVNVEFGNAEYVVLENGDTVPDAVKGGTIISIMGQAEWGDTFLGDNDYATFECQGVGLVESQLNTPPELTATSPDGTMIGSDGWTGTGFVCTAANTKYAITSANVFGGLLGFNRFCLRFADVSGNKWKNWSPWLDIDGVTYEFFYSPARKLYEALIPATTKTAEEIVSSIRWERAEPDVIRYGKISNMFSINSVVSDETETVYYNMYTDEASLRDYSGKYTEDDSKVAMAFFGGEITLPADNIPNNIIHKLFLALDINCDGKFRPTVVAAISRKVKSAAVFTVETIDNFA